MKTTIKKRKGFKLKSPKGKKKKVRQMFLIDLPWGVAYLRTVEEKEVVVLQFGTQEGKWTDIGTFAN